MRLLLCALILLLAACTPSLQPLYTDKDVIFDPALLGIWRDVKESKNYFVATRTSNEKTYRLLQSDGGTGAPFAVRLLKLGDLRFVDLHPDEPVSTTGFFNGHLVRTHTFGRIELKNGRLTLGLLDPDWFKTDEAKDSPVKPIFLDEQPLLTDSTSALQQFALKYAGSKAFETNSEWTREAK